MRLRLNTTLRAALIAAITAVGFTLTAGQQAQAATPESYSGLILTWNNTTKGTDMAYGQYRVTSYSEGVFTDDNDQRAGWTNPVQGLIGTNNTADRNTLRFAANTYGQTLKAINYGFNPLALAGFIVDAGATGYTISSSGDAQRAFYLGNDNTNTAAYSSINENFTFDKTGGENKVYLRGIQTIDVASGKTFTLGSNNGFDFTSNLDLTVTGGGTLALTRGAVTMASGSSVDIAAGSTMTLASSLAMDSNSTFSNAGNLTLNGEVTFASAGIKNTGTITLGDNIVFNLSNLTAEGNKYTLFTGSGLDLTQYSLSAANISGIVTAGKTFTFNNDGTITFESSPVKSWTAEVAAYWNYEDANWSGGKFVSGDSALFNLSESYATVNVAVQAAGIEVASGCTVTLNSSGDGSLSSASLVLGDGAVMASILSINGVEDFSVGNEATWNILANQTLGKGTNNGTIYVGTGATARLTDASNSKDLLLGITGEGNIEVAVNTNIEGGINEATKVSSQATGKLIIDQGVTLGFGRPAISGGFSQRYVDFSSFTGVDLNGGTLQVHMNNLVLNNLTVGTANSNLKILDTANVNTPALTLQGTTTLNTDLTLTSSWKHQLVIEKLAGTGTLNLNGSDNSVVNIGTPGGDTGTVGKISVQTDVTKATLNGTLTITGNLEAKKGTTNIAGTVDVKGEIDLSSAGNATGTILVKNGGSLTAPGMWGRSAAHLNIEKGGTVNLAKLSIVGADSEHLASIATTGGNTLYGVTDNTWTISNASITAKDNVTIGNKLSSSSINAGSHTVSLTNSGNVLTGGSVAEGGSLSIAGAAMMGSAIDNAGNVILTGEIEIGMMDYKDASTYSGGANEGNGFATAAYEYSLVTDATKLNMTGATITYFEMDVTDSVKDGKYVASYATPDYTTFYVNKLSETVSKAKSSQELESIVVAADGTLEVDQDIDLSLVDSSSTGTINIDQNKTVTAGDATTGTKLAGEGNIVLKSGATNLAGATMTEDWAGTAKVSGTINNIDLNNYGQEGSKVEMNGVSGYFLQAQKEFAPELVLGENGLTINNGFSTLASGNPKPPTKYTFAGGVSGEGVMDFNKTTDGVVTQHLYFTGDVSDWNGELKVTKNFTVYAQYSGTEQEVNSTITREAGTLYVEAGTGSDADVVTFNRAITADSFTVMQGATANVNGDLTATTIAVAAGATMNMAGGTLSNAITNSGTVALTGTVLDANGFSEASGGTAYVALNGDVVTEETNHYVGSQTYVQVVNNAENATSTGTAMWKGTSHELNANGRIITGASEVDYTTFYVTTGESLSNIKASEHGGALAAVNVSGGALVVNQDAAGIAIKVTEEGTITGEYADASKVGIDYMATASYTGTVAEGGISITPGEGKTVSVTNYGEDVSGYTADNGQLLVGAENGTLTMTKNDGDVVVNNYIVKLGNLVNTTGNALTLSGQDILELNDMNITGSTVGLVYTDEQMAPVEGTVSISGVLQGGDATLLANLTLVGGADSMLDVNGGGLQALTLGSKLTIDTTGGLVNLDQNTIDALAGLSEGKWLDLIVAADQTTLDYGGSYEGVSYDTLFSATGLTGPYTVYAHDNAFGIVRGSQVPEPTTGTLSLLALAALAARRRRK